MAGFSEAEWENVALDLLAGPLDWQPKAGDKIAPGSGERDSWDELLIRPRLLDSLRRLNPTVPGEYLVQALAEIASPKSQDAITENQRIHDYLIDGFRLSYIGDDGTEVNPSIRLVSAEPSENDWLAVNQVTLIRGDYKRRFDLVLYCNGMPVSIIELKKAGSETADVAAAHAQLQTYLREFPMAFRFCVFTLASDGILAKYGTPFTPLNHFSPWNVDDDGTPVKPGDTNDWDATTGMEIALLGLYNQERFLQLLRSFTAFDEGADGLAKRIAKPHQYFAVTKAVGSTVQAVESNGKAGVVWHTQGSGKSMEMELYTNLVSRHPKLKNPTVVVITDRNELDGQLYETFAQSLLLPGKPQQIKRRSELRDELSNRATGGIYFTTLQKFGRSEAEKQAGAEHPLLSDRRNIIVVVDEAHRSHYDDLDGYARHLRDALPHATLIAFTGTPISFDDRNTRDVFGEYIDIYDLSRAVDDGATVPVYFEPRLIKVNLATEVTEETLDRAADEATVGLDDTERARIEASVAVVNAVYGAPDRIAALAEDIVTHWENRSGQMTKFIKSPGKAMIVGGTREICANLYSAIVALRPAWHSDDLDKGVIKVVYSGTASDKPPVSDHVRRSSANAVVKGRLKDVDDELQLVIVKDMMLTGYDSPPLHTLYLDRPLKGALLMQTLARVNRTFRGKEDGLLVAYAPLADNLAKALGEYTKSDQESKPIGRDVDDAIVLTLSLVDTLRAMLAGYDWKAELAKGGPKRYLNAVTGAVNYLRDAATPGNQVADGEETLAAAYRRYSGQLSRAWALCSGAGSQELEERRPEIQLYEEARVWMAKFDAAERQASGQPVPEDVQRLLGELIASATSAGGVLDIYEAAGMPKPSLDDLSPGFMAKTQQARNPQLAIEALRKLLTDEAVRTTRNNLVRQRAFSDRISELMNKYTNQQLTSAEVIAELVALAREVAAEANRGAGFTPPLNHDELAFFDAVAQNESAVEVQGEGVLADIARELVAVMRRDVRTDWTVRDDVRAKLRSSIKRLLVKHGYPPDRQPVAIKLVMEQMESMAPRYSEERAA
ncbi:type I restriction endonuclease subunit R [Cryobacterium psychrophilum]|uniref:Type I restriction enzyme endonuclease subunit n=1 Tax=Cryobacterium psychrophilum TaxID=41988 RepID=A0A4Y8KLA4_9MICO|nr:type I restriction endonuclease subunit R [Cryobacterium psychrophilum]TDW28937.1 type I restriction enzyme R subunit [Cryobacterium psychrophilum]TFD76885.1 type I restriction endonuclease subunit R [Cryobacterium psychrophilum]